MLKPFAKHFRAPVLLLLIVLTLLLLHWTGAFSWQWGKPVPTVSTLELKGLVNTAVDQASQEASKGYVLVDVRSEAEVEVSVIPGAITKAQYEANRDKYQDQTVIAYCTIGVRSRSYTKRLLNQGLEAMNYEGSILEWVGEGLPLVTLTGQPTKQVHTYSKQFGVPPGYQQVIR